MDKHSFTTIVFKKLRQEIGIKTLLISIMMIETLILIVFNNLSYRYQGVSYLDIMWLYNLPMSFILFLVSLYIEEEAPRIANLLKVMWVFNVFAVAIAVLCYAIQFTPFALYDKAYYALDAMLGFDVITVLNWTHSHPWLYNYFEYIYTFLYIELLCIPVILSCLLEKRKLDIYFISLMLATLIGFTLYYFWPSTNPAAISSDAYFLPSMHAAVSRFYNIHHYLPLHSAEGGLVGFPSFHVIWAIAIVVACFNQKWLFYPIALVNITIILSTLGLGWHYLVDVVAGIIIIALCTYWGSKLTS